MRNINIFHPELRPVMPFLDSKNEKGKLIPKLSSAVVKNMAGKVPPLNFVFFIIAEGPREPGGITRRNFTILVYAPKSRFTFLVLRGQGHREEAEVKVEVE